MSHAMPAAQLTLALIAHDNKKAAIVEFASKNKEKLAQFKLIGTGTTSSRIAAATGLPIEALLSGPLGGDAQIGGRVAEGRCDAIIFIVDPLSAHPHDPDIHGLLRICNVYNKPVATNIAAAELILDGLCSKTG